MEGLLFPFSVSVIVFVLTVMSVRIVLPILMRKHAGQVILEIGPNWHKSKEGTPTMGGIAPLFAVTFGTGIFLLYSRFHEMTTSTTPFLLTLLFAISNATIGMIDDCTKLVHKRNLGLTPLQKLVLQSAFAIAYLLLLRIFDCAQTSFRLPFTNSVWELGIFWYPLCYLFIIWFVNCANLTDGIDGLASSVATVIGLIYLLLSVSQNDFSLSLGGGAMFGSALGFFLFNKHPAHIFMGDTGSLFFGALAIGCAMIYGSPLLLLVLGAVYVLEGISVLLQVVVFKITHGKRVFRMAPFHHHLEKCGWSEWKITTVFVLVTAILGALVFWGFR